MTKVAQRQPLIRQRPYADAFQLYHWMPNALKHSPHLMVPALHERDFVPGFVASGQQANATRGSAPSVQRDTPLKFRQILRVSLAVDFDLIRPGDSGGTRHQEIGQLAVVGEQDE